MGKKVIYSVEVKMKSILNKMIFPEYLSDNYL